MGIIFIGILGLLIKRNIIMKLLSLDIMGTGVVSYFVYISSETGTVPPITLNWNLGNADPVPQAVIITSIVINFATLALAILITMILATKALSLDSTKLDKRVID